MTYSTKIYLLLDIINAMKRQEKSGYRTRSELYNNRSIDNTIEIRRLMVLWCKQLTDLCKFNHQTMAIAINILDRFVAKEPAILLNRDKNNAAHHHCRDFRLAAVSSLYTSIKAHEISAIDPKTMSKLSQDVFSSKEIEEMESRILTKLGWRVNTPTAMAFAEIYLQMILIPTDDKTKTIIKKLIQCQIEYAMEDCRFLGIDASEIAFIAIYNALMATFGHASYLGNLQQDIDVNSSSFYLENILMDHMQRSESATIFSLKITTTEPTKKKQRFEQKSPSSFTRHHLSPRSSITIPQQFLKAENSSCKI
mmetsp:Transcript_32164/g.36571  ORF Transcript_32164/g.36571 Transcript_32164/m.36571 type:complete len:309 (+) Transcript_32164:86-1012(+)